MAAGLRVVFVGSYFGKGFDAGGVDLLAFQPSSRHAWAVSCTIGNKLSDKVESLLMKVSQLAENLPDWTVLGSLVAPVARRDVTFGGYLDAYHAGIGLMLRYEIGRLYDAANISEASAGDLAVELLSPEIYAARLSDSSPEWFELWLAGDD